MGIGTLRRYHKPLPARDVETQPGLTDTPELEAAAVSAEEGKLGEVQEEQRELAAAADPQPEGDAIHPVVEGDDPEVSAEHQEQRAADAAEAPKRNASTETWREYVAGLSEQPQGWEDMGRDELATAVLGDPQD